MLGTTKPSRCPSQNYFHFSAENGNAKNFVTIVLPVSLNYMVNSKKVEML